MANYAQGHGSPEAAARSKGTKGGGANDAGLGARLRAGRAGGGHRDNAHNTTLACNPGICYREPSHPNRPPLSLRCLRNRSLMSRCCRSPSPLDEIKW
jgi:hypothetical protein